MGKKIKKEEIEIKINNVCLKYGYTYKMNDYTNTFSEILVTCNHHNFQWKTRVGNFIIEKSKCKSCLNDKKIENSKNISFNKIKEKCDKMNYSFIGLKDKDKNFNVKEKLIIKCNIDNKVWYPSTDNFIRKNSNCPTCSNETGIPINYMIEDIIKKSKETKRTITNLYSIKYATSKLNVICDKCSHSWNSNYKSFIKHHGCRKCLNINKLTTIDAITKIKEKCELLNYDFLKFKTPNNLYENIKTKIQIKCNKNHIFEISYNNFIHSEQGCSICKESKGEVKIRLFLNQNKIVFIPQHRFSECRNKRPLPFDFYVPTYNLLIEYDGQQHFEQINFNGNKTNLEYIKNNDLIKNDFCKKNNINILRINYNDNVLEKLNQFFKLS